MKQNWLVEPNDIEQVRALVHRHEDNPFVRKRTRRNPSDGKSKVKVGKDDFWQQMVACLLTTRQRSDPESPVGRIITTEPFPLSYAICLEQQDLRAFANRVLTDFGGIRRTTVIPDHLAENLELLDRGFWEKTLIALENVRLDQNSATERKTAHFIADHFAGFGPKQSRNLLQCLGLTRHEIPLDSRITDWLNAFGFPVCLSSTVLADWDYYCFVMDGIQALCAACDVVPCILDACIFVNDNPGAWTEENVKRMF